MDNFRNACYLNRLEAPLHQCTRIFSKHKLYFWNSTNRAGMQHSALWHMPSLVHNSVCMSTRTIVCGIILL